MVGDFSVELLDQDETIYALVALELLSGELPYQAIFDHKPIGIYYIYAIFMGLFGKSFYAIRIMTMLMIVVANHFSVIQFTELHIITLIAFTTVFPRFDHNKNIISHIKIIHFPK
jgi:4-amino-4-deoxy-L-arabinose transferase-like glycosyltransferase